MKDGSPYGPLHASGPSHRKVFALADRLCIQQAHAFGLLCTLWARALTEARDGQVFGGPSRVAQLAGWHADAQVFFDALVYVGALDVDGKSVRIHDWSDYGGRSLAAIAARVENGKRGGRKPAGSNRPDQTIRVEPADLLLSSLLSSSDQEEIAHPVPTSTPMEASKPRSGLQTRRADTAHGQVEASTQPKTPAEVLAHPYWGKQLREKFPALQWSGATQTLIGDITARFSSFQRKYERDGKDAAYSALIGWIAQDYPKHEMRWKREQTVAGHVDTAAIRAIAGTANMTRPPVFDDEDTS